MYLSQQKRAEAAARAAVTASPMPERFDELDKLTASVMTREAEKRGITPKAVLAEAVAEQKDWLRKADAKADYQRTVRGL
jgi:hypothetical protein